MLLRDAPDGTLGIVIVQTREQLRPVPPPHAVRQRCVAAHQSACAVAVALGLEHLIACNLAALADGAVHGADIRGMGQRACAGVERAGEKLVEALVTGRVRVGRFAHVHVVALDEPVDDAGGRAAPLAARHPARKGGQGLLGDQVLRQNRQAVREGTGHEGAAKAVQDNCQILSGRLLGFPPCGWRPLRPKGGDPTGTIQP